jgi:hypothetical protein
MRRLMTLPIALLLLGAAPSAASADVDFSFRGYANNVKAVPPLVGDFQLGKARIHGSGLLGASASGTIVAEGEPKFSRYPPSSMRAQVIGYKARFGAHDSFTKITLIVEIISATNEGKDCTPGVRGKIKLLDTKSKLDNGESADHIVMGDWTGDRCPGLVQGWTNDDGGERTSPQYGGPPKGGQWAVVRADH